jgi:hypothetical protein
MAGQNQAPTIDELRNLFQEVAEMFRETDAKFKETDAKFKETDAKFKETDARFKETDARFKETDARMDQRSRETDEKLRRLEGLFTSQWGKLIEALVQPNALKLFRERGIQVHYVYQRAKSQQNGDTMEIDLILENATEIVVVEAKSTLKIEGVDEFLDDLGQFTHFFPKYAGRRIYGAIAGVTIDENADRYAYKRGLFVLGMAGDGMIEIKNDAKFKPRDFSIAS